MASSSASLEMQDTTSDGGSPLSSNSVYETKYQKSLRHYLTREALPKESNYRNLKSIVDASLQPRPTLDDLQRNTIPRHPATPHGAEEALDKEPTGKVKLGWMKGVLMPCMLNIWGVMLFLRISWVVGQAGLSLTLIIVCSANLVTFITALSMSAVATNGLIQGGGVYYMISRSLGPEFGGSIGLMFTLANSIAVSTYIIGFVNSLQDLLILDWVTRVQIGLLFLLIGSQVDFVIGAFVGPLDDTERAQGFVGLSGELFSRNFYNDFRYAEGSDQNLFSVFAVFFPAVTGIVAGANLSGDLKDPCGAIPKGTLLAIGITFLTYIGYPFLLAATVVRDASGNVTEFLDYIVNDTEFIDGEKSILDAPSFTGETCSNLGPAAVHPLNLTRCAYGLHNNFQVMELVSVWGPLIYAGCFAATLSSAVASLVGAPRVLQALAKDRLYPGIHTFSCGYGPSNDPVNGYILVFIIALGCIMIGELNAVSTLLSNFFLASYSLINFSCFHASLIKSPGWRPAFKVYVNWGSSAQAATYSTALKNTLELQTVEDHIKNFRPQILVLSGPPSTRPSLVDFGNVITKNISLLLCGHVGQNIDWKKRHSLMTRGTAWLLKYKIRGFFSVVEAKDLETGAVNFFQLSGLGKLRPNMALLGFKSDWKTCDKDEVISYFNTLHSASATLVLQVQYGHESETSSPPATPDIDRAQNVSGLDGARDRGAKKRKGSMTAAYVGKGGTKLTKSALNNITLFQRKQRKGTIDVWWLYDDGGLTLLIPYIVNTRSKWSSCKMRIFTLANRRDELDMEQRSMASLLSKFRIDYSDVIVIPDAMKKASEAAKADFEALIEKFKTDGDVGDGMTLTETELMSQREKTNRHIRLRELLVENSIILFKAKKYEKRTLPMPRKGQVSASLYMAWLDYMTKGMPPFLFVRGNQQSVLTYYS
ncbi:bumetanide-sensitive sodium-(potassium)-chloride cotransporter [Hyalella azteca]|uniref:Bumetanide-sensitive sodium-(Potassium)-chloride cotransporter n=1 Tax=Hyalella azteca TaxID=294128 RepID=A0A8B7N4W7_HYAAZ|nr:bumetanide-sensitive sodium-(potassium)-chloride cotransporter [Hyalella azteca]